MLCLDRTMTGVWKLNQWEDRRLMEMDGNMLRKARNYLALSQVEAAERCGVSAIAYQRWETDKARPQPLHRRGLQEAFADAFHALGIVVENDAAIRWEANDERDRSFKGDLPAEESASSPVINAASADPPLAIVPPETQTIVLSE